MIESLKTEMDVRELVIRPLLEKLGYTPDMVVTERPLIYKAMFLGGKKPKTDRPLRGRIDYLCEVDDLRVVIEAKAPGPITVDDREQAYSYAAHAEIAARFYAVISGTHFELYENFVAPDKALILAYTWVDHEKMVERLANVIGPVALKRDFKKYVPDPGKPLAKGLRSYVREIRGKQTIIEPAPHMPHTKGVSVIFTGGAIARGADGGMLMQLIPTHSTQVMTDFANTMGIAEVLYYSPEETISTDPAKPTEFYSESEFPFKEGMPVPSMTEFNRTFPSPITATVKGSAKMVGFLKETQFLAWQVARSTNPEVGPFEIHFDMELTFS